MNRNTYYERMKSVAREVRGKYHLVSPRLTRTDLRDIYKDQGVKIDKRHVKLKNLRGAYFDDELGPSVMIAANLPDDPYIFTLAHELKHHLVDRGVAIAYCTKGNQNEYIEIGAEVFAAELIFPENDFAAFLGEIIADQGQFTPEALVQLKHDTRTTLSYTGLVKRTVRLGFAPAGILRRIKWKNLEERIYGVPYYKRFHS